MFVLASSPPVATRLGLPPLHFAVGTSLYLLPAACLLLGASLLSPKGVYRLAIGLLAPSLAMLVADPADRAGDQGRHGAGCRSAVWSSSRASSSSRRWSWWSPRSWRARRACGNACRALLLTGLGACFLLLAQPDVSMALMVATLFAVQLFLAGLPWLLVLGLAALGVLALWQAYLFFPHVAERFDRFLDPDLGRSLSGRPRARGRARRRLVRQRSRRGPGQVCCCPMPTATSCSR